MKNLSRLTALLLAIAVLMTGMPLMALADSITVDIDTWNSWVEEAQNAAANQTETVTTTVPVTGETSVVDRPVVEAALTAHAGTETGATQAVTLPIAGKLVLKAFDGASSYQWQVKAGSQWANIVGDRSASTTLTYAKIQNAISGGVAQVRCVMVVDGQDYVSATAQVTVDDTVTYTTVETESTLTVTSEVPVQRNYVLRNTANYNLDAQSDEDGTETEPEKVTITIDYVLDSGDSVSSPYVATIGKGEDLTTAVIQLPVVQGYVAASVTPVEGATFVLPTDDSTGSVQLHLTNVTSDQEYKVHYVPDFVDFTVEHYLMGFDAEQSTADLQEDDTKVFLKEKKTGEAVGTGLEKDYTGFQPLWYNADTKVAADGSTIIKIYYERLWYLMLFDLDGGYGVEPIYAQFGAPVSVDKEPTKAGYTFEGWSLNGGEPTKELPTTMPAENRTYKAVWKAGDTAKVTVVFWGENANDEEYSYIKSIQLDKEPGTTFTVTEEDSNNGYIHSHNKDCYGKENVGDQVSNSRYTVSGTESNGYIGEYGRTDWWGNFTKVGNCIFIDGTWYTYTGSVEPGNIANTTCVYLDSNLWTFKESDTVTVAADGSTVVNVYYDRTKFVLTFKYGNTTLGTINERWGANIVAEFTAMCDAARAKTSKYSGWEDSTTGNYVDYIGIMPQMNKTLTVNTTNSTSTSTMTYYYEDLNGNYNELFKIQFAGNYNVTEDEYYEIEGFSIDKDRSTKIGSNCNGAKFYYTRNSYKLTFNDGYNNVKTETVLYEAPLSPYAYVPVAPSAYEPGSVTFGGWYLNPECTGEEYKLNAHTMPADNVLLYAKWVPVKHNVTFYLKQDFVGTDNVWVPTFKVEHRKTVEEANAGVMSQISAENMSGQNGNYTFVGWFYMDGDVEKAFDPATMPVTKDLQIYGKWNATQPVQFTIYYYLADKDGKQFVDENGNPVPVAELLKSQALDGTTVTVDAKGGSELYAEYREGYFPQVSSHSLTIDVNAVNSFVFLYRPVPKVPYKVVYLIEDDTQESGYRVHDVKMVEDNTKVVVTEGYLRIPGYMPDAYQKRLVVSYPAVEDNGNNKTDPGENIIYFYYHVDTVNAFYTVSHFIEPAYEEPDYTKWDQYGLTESQSGTIGQPYTATPKSITGFELIYKEVDQIDGDGNVTTKDTELTETLTAGGMDFRLYYKRIEYPYVVRYLELNTNIPLAAEVKGTGKYGTVVTEEAKEIDNYTVVTTSPQHITIQVEKGDEAQQNIITFYYTENEATINYVVVGPEGCGSVTPTSETLKVLSGEAKGSTPTAYENFKFVGWYTDADCKVPVYPNWVDGNNKITPVKDTVAAWVDDTTYYAKFEYNLTTLTITKSGMDPIDAGQSFLFKVEGPNLPYDGLLIAINGNGSETISGLLVGGKYTVTEVTDWSWRYTAQSVTSSPLAADGQQNSVTVPNTRKKDKWLDGDCYAENVFNTQGNVQGE